MSSVDSPRSEGGDALIHKPPTGGLLSLLVLLVSVAALIPATLLLGDLLDLYASSTSGLNLQPDEAAALRAAIARESLQTGLLILGAVVALILWCGRAASNVQTLRAANHGLGGPTVLLGFLLPVYHWVKPYLIFTTLWKTSDAGSYPGDLSAWRNAPSSFLLTLWWFCWLLCMVSASFLSLFLLLEDGPPEDALMFFDLAFYSVLAAIPLLLLNLVVTRTLDRRQIERWQAVRAFLLRRRRGGMDVSGIYQRPELKPPTDAEGSSPGGAKPNSDSEADSSGFQPLIPPD
ncbi:MAG: DUF4328 domain-containing protein [Acidobacteriota bacterium]